MTQNISLQSKSTTRPYRNNENFEGLEKLKGHIQKNFGKYFFSFTEGESRKEGIAYLDTDMRVEVKEMKWETYVMLLNENSIMIGCITFNCYYEILFINGEISEEHINHLTKFFPHLKKIHFTPTIRPIS